MIPLPFNYITEPSACARVQDSGHPCEHSAAQPDPIQRAVRGGWFHAPGQSNEGSAAGAAGVDGQSQDEHVVQK